MRLKVRSQKHFFQSTRRTKSEIVLRILGIYSMDELNRTDWDKLGKYRARKGPAYVAKYCREILSCISRINAE
jgi:hypothetical protein